MRRAVTTLALLVGVAQASSKSRNVYGDTLQSCSYDGTALTGYTRNGYCKHKDGDKGSHHICIDLGEITYNNDDDDGNGEAENFCTVTGQANWCSNDNLPCHDDSSSSTCPIENWCVCQWAFASYIENAGGCDKIQTIVCESINLHAARAYVKRSGVDAKYASALECLASRCDLDLSNEELYGKPLSKTEIRMEEISKHILGPLVVTVSVFLVALYIAKKRRFGDYDKCSSKASGGSLDGNTPRRSVAKMIDVTPPNSSSSVSSELDTSYRLA